MTEGELPEIFEQLKDSLPSVEAHEQDERRAFYIQDYARKRQIPQENMETNATVKRYVTVLADADWASERLRGNRTKDVSAEDPRATERTGQAAALYHAETVILEEGLHSVLDIGTDLPAKRIDLDPVRRTSLTSLLDRAGKPFGVGVAVPEGWRRQQFYDVQVRGKPFRPQGEPATGLWTGGPLLVAGEEPWTRPGDRFHEWYWPDMPNERHDPEHLRALAEEARRHGVDPDRPRTDPVMHTLLTGLVYGRRLISETQDVTGLPPAPGLTPPAHERLARVAPLNRLAVAVLEDAVRPGSVDRGRFAAELATVAQPYGLVVKGGSTDH